MRAVLVVLAVVLAGCVVADTSTTTVPASKKPAEPVEMYYEPEQCGNVWNREGRPAEPGSPEEKELIRDHFAQEGVTLGDLRFERVYETVCAACSCPRGDWVIGPVPGEDFEAAKNLGWNEYTGLPTTSST